jgi:cytochrome c biogenesis protein CcmG, thiol:disulfide interchange protein DsbE
MNKIIKLLVVIFAVCLISKQSFAQGYDFELQDINGDNVKLSNLLKKGPVLISFWALWCVPCKEEMKVMSELNKKLKDSGMVYITINEDETKSSAKVKSYIESKGYDFPALLDPDKYVFEKFGGQNLPYSLLLNTKGEMVKVYSGYVPGDEKHIEEDILQTIKASKDIK